MKKLSGRDRVCFINQYESVTFTYKCTFFFNVFLSYQNRLKVYYYLPFIFGSS
jgi:hypothetical protein